MEDPRDLDELHELDPNDDQAVLQPETRYKQKFLTAEYAASSWARLFFQMLNNKEPEGNPLAYLYLSVVFMDTFQLLLFDVRALLFTSNIFFRISVVHGQNYCIIPHAGQGFVQDHDPSPVLAVLRRTWYIWFIIFHSFNIILPSTSLVKFTFYFFTAKHWMRIMSPAEFYHVRYRFKQAISTVAKEKIMHYANIIIFSHCHC